MSYPANHGDHHDVYQPTQDDWSEYYQWLASTPGDDAPPPEPEPETETVYADFSNNDCPF